MADHLFGPSIEEDTHFSRERSYADRRPITEYIPPKKQAAKRHYGSHQYFTKRAWNVVQAYIERFTNEGDVVCDPYGGSGVTAIEALALGRRAIYLDISRWACFLAQQVAAHPVDFKTLVADFEKVQHRCAKQIDNWMSMTDHEIEQIELTRWYPKSFPLPRNADVETVEELFTKKQLLCLSELLYHINQTKSRPNRDLLRYAFSATLYMCNKTFISSAGRLASRGGSSIFSIYRYKVARNVIELHPFKVFEKRFGGLLECKKDTEKVFPFWTPDQRRAYFLQGYAQNLSKYAQAESVDYIFTDPPYGSHIAYLDLTRMWDAWLGFVTTRQDYEHEVIEDGDLGHSAEHFRANLKASIHEMFRVLKYDRWLSIVFAHREPAMWDTIVKAAEGAGFEYVNTVAQPLNVVWSMHKKKNPLTVVSGELILNFRKVQNPKTLWITNVGTDALSIVKDSAELSIVQRDGATTDEICTDLIPKLLENGLLGRVAEKIGDITPLLAETFSHSETTQTWHIKPGRKIGYHIPLEQRIRFYVVDYLKQKQRLDQPSTIDDIILSTLPKLKNGTQPNKQKIIDEIKKVATPIDNKYWTLQTGIQHELHFENKSLKKQIYIPKMKPDDSYSHNELIYALAMIGRSAGFGCHIGKREQTQSWDGQSLGSLVDDPLGFLNRTDNFTKQKVEQIDLIWLDGGRPAMAFEVEHTTSITAGLDRFIELLKIDHQIAGKMLIVIPCSRRKKLDQVLKSSHYIGSPMYLDKKVRYIWYSDISTLANRLATTQASKPGIMEAVLGIAHRPGSEE